MEITETAYAEAQMEIERLRTALENMRRELNRAWREVDFIAKERTEHLEWRTKLANDLGECERMRDVLARTVNVLDAEKALVAPHEPVAWLDPSDPDADSCIVLDRIRKHGKDNGMEWWKRYTVPLYATTHAVQGEPVAFVITDEKINFLQVNSIKRFIERAKHAHFTDIYYRINGKDEVVQADWLKHLQLAAPPADDEAVRLLTEVAETVPNMSIELEQAINAYLAKAEK